MQKKIIPWLLCALLWLVPTNTTAKEAPLFYTLKIAALHPEASEALTVGAPLADRVGKYAIGEVVSVDRAPHMVERYSKRERKMKLVPHPYLVTLTVTVRAKGEKQGKSCKIGGYTLTEGGTVSFFSPLFAGVGECISLTVSEVS